MSHGQLADQRLDVIVGARIFNGCWFMAGLGIAIFQMRLLAQAWQQSHLAMWTACVASCWIVGSVLISRFDPRQQRSARLWGASCIICALLWLPIPLLAHSFSPSLPFSTAISLCELGISAFLMGIVSTAWIVQRRPWPAVGERTALAKGLMGTMVGLCVVWLFPAWAGSLGLICLFPLLVLDFWPQAQCPLPAPGKMLDNWYDISQGADRWQLRLNKRRLPRGWWWSYLVQRGHLFLVFLASSIAVILGSIWSAVPTAFAAGLFEIHAAGILAWLVIGQLIALSIGVCCFLAARGVLGAPDRLIPQQWEVRAWFTAISMLFLMACSLLALGLPFLQAPGSLAGSLAIYTFAGAVWGILLPRLKPSLSTIVYSQRHLLFHQGSTQLGKGRLAYERAQEEQINRLCLTVEGFLTALLAPGIGGLVDRWGVDYVLVGAGLFLILFLGLSLTVIGLVWEISYWRPQSIKQNNLNEITWEEAQISTQRKMEIVYE